MVIVSDTHFKSYFSDPSYLHNIFAVCWTYEKIQYYLLIGGMIKKFFCRLDDDVVISGRQENNSFGWNKIGLEIY